MGKKVVFIVLDSFADWEGAYLSSVLLDDEIEMQNQVLWASIDKYPKKSLGNMTMVPDITLDEIPDDTDALIFIGGNSWRTQDSNKVTATVEKFMEQGKILGFICDATYFAAREGFLNDIKHTGNDPSDMIDEGKYNNPEGFQMEEAVLDENIITANGNSPLEFSALVLRALGLFPDEEIEMWKDFQKLGLWEAMRKYELSM